MQIKWILEYKEDSKEEILFSMKIMDIKYIAIYMRMEILQSI